MSTYQEALAAKPIAQLHFKHVAWSKMLERWVLSRNPESGPWCLWRHEDLIDFAKSQGWEG